MVITITDETFAGDILQSILLEFQSEQTTIREIIEKRVTAEVNAYNLKRPEFFTGLIEPNDAEKTLNGFRLKKHRQHVDAEKQVFTALHAFQKNGFFVLVDNQQCEDLDQVVELKSSTTVSFIKLTPLVGG